MSGTDEEFEAVVREANVDTKDVNIDKQFERVYEKCVDENVDVDARFAEIYAEYQKGDLEKLDEFELMKLMEEEHSRDPVKEDVALLELNKVYMKGRTRRRTEDSESEYESAMSSLSEEEDPEEYRPKVKSLRQYFEKACLRMGSGVNGKEGVRRELGVRKGIVGVNNAKKEDVGVKNGREEDEGVKSEKKQVENMKKEGSGVKKGVRKEMCNCTHCKCGIRRKRESGSKERKKDLSLEDEKSSSSSSDAEHVRGKKRESPSGGKGTKKGKETSSSDSEEDYESGRSEGGVKRGGKVRGGKHGEESSSSEDECEKWEFVEKGKSSSDENDRDGGGDKGKKLVEKVSKDEPKESLKKNDVERKPGTVGEKSEKSSDSSDSSDRSDSSEEEDDKKVLEPKTVIWKNVEQQFTNVETIYTDLPAEEKVLEPETVIWKNVEVKNDLEKVRKDSHSSNSDGQTDSSEDSEEENDKKVLEPETVIWKNVEQQVTNVETIYTDLPAEEKVLKPEIVIWKNVEVKNDLEKVRKDSHSPNSEGHTDSSEDSEEENDKIVLEPKTTIWKNVEQQVTNVETIYTDLPAEEKVLKPETVIWKNVEVKNDLEKVRKDSHSSNSEGHTDSSEDSEEESEKKVLEPETVIWKNVEVKNDLEKVRKDSHSSNSEGHTDSSEDSEEESEKKVLEPETTISEVVDGPTKSLEKAGTDSASSDSDVKMKTKLPAGMERKERPTKVGETNSDSSESSTDDERKTKEGDKREKRIKMKVKEPKTRTDNVGTSDSSESSSNKERKAKRGDKKETRIRTNVKEPKTRTNNVGTSDSSESSSNKERKTRKGDKTETTGNMPNVKKHKTPSGSTSETDSDSSESSQDEKKQTRRNLQDEKVVDTNIGLLTECEEDGDTLTPETFKTRGTLQEGGKAGMEGEESLSRVKKVLPENRVLRRKISDSAMVVHDKILTGGLPQVARKNSVTDLPLIPQTARLRPAASPVKPSLQSSDDRVKELLQLLKEKGLKPTELRSHYEPVFKSNYVPLTRARRRSSLGVLLEDELTPSEAMAVAAILHNTAEVVAMQKRLDSLRIEEEEEVLREVEFIVGKNDSNFEVNPPENRDSLSELPKNKDSLRESPESRDSLSESPENRDSLSDESPEGATEGDLREVEFVAGKNDSSSSEEPFQDAKTCDTSSSESEQLERRSSSEEPFQDSKTCDTSSSESEQLEGVNPPDNGDFQTEYKVNLSENRDSLPERVVNPPWDDLSESSEGNEDCEMNPENGDSLTLFEVNLPVSEDSLTEYVLNPPESGDSLTEFEVNLPISEDSLTEFEVILPVSGDSLIECVVNPPWEDLSESSDGNGEYEVNVPENGYSPSESWERNEEYEVNPENEDSLSDISEENGEYEVNVPENGYSVSESSEGQGEYEVNPENEDSLSESSERNGEYEVNAENEDSLSDISEENGEYEVNVPENGYSVSESSERNGEYNVNPENEDSLTESSQGNCEYEVNPSENEDSLSEFSIGNGEYEVNPENEDSLSELSIGNGEYEVNPENEDSLSESERRMELGPFAGTEKVLRVSGDETMGENRKNPFEEGRGIGEMEGQYFRSESEEEGNDWEYSRTDSEEEGYSNPFLETEEGNLGGLRRGNPFREGLEVLVEETHAESDGANDEVEGYLQQLTEIARRSSQADKAPERERKLSEMARRSSKSENIPLELERDGERNPFTVDERRVLFESVEGLEEREGGFREGSGEEAEGWRVYDTDDSVCDPFDDEGPDYYDVSDFLDSLGLVYTSDADNDSIKDISGHLEIAHVKQNDPPQNPFPKSPVTVNFDLEVAAKLLPEGAPGGEEEELPVPENFDPSKKITKAKGKKGRGKTRLPQRQDSGERSSVEVEWDFEEGRKSGDFVKSESKFVEEERLRDFDANGKKDTLDSDSDSDSRDSAVKRPQLNSPGKRTIASSSGSDVALHEGAELSPDDNPDLIGADGLRNSMQNILDQFMIEERRFDNQ